MHMYLLRNYNNYRRNMQHQIISKKVIFKNSASFTNCMSRINNTQVDDASDNDVVMPMYNLL